MPPVPASMTVFSHRPIDADAGVRDEIPGLCLEPLTITPSFDTFEYRGGKSQQAVFGINKKELTLDVSAKVLKRSGIMSHCHPGTPIHRSYVTDFHADVSFGFDANPASPGMLIYLPESASIPQGEYDQSKFKLKLWQETANTVDLPAAPSYP